MRIKQVVKYGGQDTFYIITRDQLDVPVGLTGRFNTESDAQDAIDWYYGQNTIVQSTLTNNNVGGNLQWSIKYQCLAEQKAKRKGGIHKENSMYILGNYSLKMRCLACGTGWMNSKKMFNHSLSDSHSQTMRDKSWTKKAIQKVLVQNNKVRLVS